MMLRKKPLIGIAVIVAAFAGVAVYAQLPPAANQPKARTVIPSNEWGVLNFETKVGSFKVLSAGDTPAQGNLDISFEGTVLVSGNDATIVPEGNVRIELERKDHAKKVYFGKGKLKITGRYQAVQFFGRNLTARWHGFGIVRLYGEFDENLNTGEYWYEGQQKMPWFSGGLTIALPQPIEQAPKKPTVKPLGGG